MSDFPWVPIDKMLGPRLLDFEDRQSELLEILSKLRQRDLPVITLVDQDEEGHGIALSELNPFSFFASFNRRATSATK
jgi:hypothetical protein